MIYAAPHYLLISESQSASDTRNGGGRWRFVLEQIGGDEKLVVADSEPDVAGERLQLLTVIRGLEALDQPSRVTMLTPSKYVSCGIRRGLPHWRENGWRWERFGQMCYINDDDLWQRLDRALQLHTVDCRNWRLMNSSFGNEPWSDGEESDDQTPTVDLIKTEYHKGIERPRHVDALNEKRVTPTQRKQIVAETKLARVSHFRTWYNGWNRMLSAVPTLIL